MTPRAWVWTLMRMLTRTRHAVAMLGLPNETRRMFDYEGERRRLGLLAFTRGIETLTPGERSQVLNDLQGDMGAALYDKSGRPVMKYDEICARLWAQDDRPQVDPSTSL